MAEARSALGRQLGAEALGAPRLDVAALLAREAVALDRSPQTEGTLLTTLLRSPAVVATFSLLSAGLFVLLSRVLFRPCSGVQFYPPTFDRSYRFITLWPGSPAVLDQSCQYRELPRRSVIPLTGFVHAATGGWQLPLVALAALATAGLMTVRNRRGRRPDTADVAWADLMGRVII